MTLWPFPTPALADAGGAALMAEKLSYLGPEIALFVATVVAMVLGLSPKRSLRDATPVVAILGVAVAGVLAVLAPTMPDAPYPALMQYGKVLVAIVGLLLVLLLTGTVDRDYEARVAKGLPFDGLRSTRGEFYAFLLFSLTGLMLCFSADDLIWLFLALELTSLPTYVMVSISTARSKSQEAGIKYFFLGAFGAAIFLFGFALLYGATGTTLLFGGPDELTIASVLAADGFGPLATLGVGMAIIGICFKIAAVPMHFYTPDVYEGSATSVSAFLAFVPKTAGFVALALVLSAVGWTYGPEGDALPASIHAMLWFIAAATMTAGNVLALLQKNVKRMLAYSSVAHSGYMLVGLIAGPGTGDSLASNGLGALFFYLLCYGVMNLGSFAVLACVERASGAEIETIDDIKGLCKSMPVYGWVMVLTAGSLLGLPPLLGFWGKLYLFTSGIAAGEFALVVILGLNSAIAAFYYLKLMSGPFIDAPGADNHDFRATAFPGRTAAAVLSAGSVVALVPFVSALTQAADQATRPADTEAEAASETEPDAAVVVRDETDTARRSAG